jgi:hypothetical protein
MAAATISNEVEYRPDHIIKQDATFETARTYESERKIVATNVTTKKRGN